nr:MAG TPA: hypothetical protein [Caudoviricetes sp.]
MPNTFENEIGYVTVILLLEPTHVYPPCLIAYCDNSESRSTADTVPSSSIP